jgi:spore coat polysaccharide biosynthesis protein SpsF
MRIGAIVQARMTSERLPGKSLRPLCGKPMLQYVLERLTRIERFCKSQSLAETIVATSADRSDDPIAEFCTTFDTHCFRGPLENVAQRFLQAALAHELTAFVRVSGDSPLLDQRLVARGLDLFAESQPDVATNVFPRTWPAGMSVEVIRTATFERVVPELTEQSDREHVTTYLYSRPDRFRIANFARDVPRRDVHLAVDTAEHFENAARIIGSMTRPHWEYSLDDVLQIYDGQASSPAAISSQVTQPQVLP